MHTEKTPLFLRKLKREFLVGLSKIGVRSTSLNYGGLKVKIPLIYGIGRFHFNPDFSGWMKNNLKVATSLWPEQAVVDVGANVGQFMLNLKSVNNEVPYYGFEPNPPCMFYLYELMRINKFPKTHVFPVAVSTTDEISYLYSSAWDSGTSSLVKGYNPSKDEYSTSIYSVEGNRFLSTIKEEISLIKIDVEGFEFEVLKGIKDIIKTKRPIIFCEILSDIKDNEQIKQNIQNIHDLMQEIGFKAYKSGPTHLPELVNSIEDYHCKHSQDYVFVPEAKVEKYLAQF